MKDFLISPDSRSYDRTTEDMFSQGHEQNMSKIVRHPTEEDWLTQSQPYHPEIAGGLCRKSDSLAARVSAMPGPQVDDFVLGTPGKSVTPKLKSSHMVPGSGGLRTAREPNSFNTIAIEAIPSKTCLPRPPASSADASTYASYPALNSLTESTTRRGCHPAYDSQEDLVRNPNLGRCYQTMAAETATGALVGGLAGYNRGKKWCAVTGLYYPECVATVTTAAGAGGAFAGYVASQNSASCQDVLIRGRYVPRHRR